MSPFQSPFSITQDPNRHFTEIAHQLRDLAAQAGVAIIPYRDLDVPIFSALREPAKRKVLQVMSHQLDFFKLAASEGLRVDSSKLIWRALAQMRMAPQPDLFDKITDANVVEVYHWDGTILFKNLKFFEYISMSLEEVYCLRWMDQGKFPARLFLFFFELSFKLRVAGYQHTFAPQFHQYTFIEKLGEHRTIAVELEWISPVQYQGERKAMLFVNRSRIV